MVLALEIFLVASAVLMTIFVLLHKGKGGGLSSLFGGGVQSNLSGSTVVEKNLDRVTIFMVIIWLACIVGLNLIEAFTV
ncbi:preprotein translocase subunit SecG [Corynebacterium endometrii]|jgi:preprotein translocase subunit SecG|uniref:Protein-export membrane protein SecG n=1 Tax=Corynebacterium endometrii TaxID=2488819 RepID=A0A4P7QHI4_9CORY|nr:preprotein translocase subunit SecG [Corynebacterium endometrii]QCB28486.1 preprotein translocase subunit SecG [Corynebacterium endometrii]